MVAHEPIFVPEGSSQAITSPSSIQPAVAAMSRWPSGENAIAVEKAPSSSNKILVRFHVAVSHSTTREAPLSGPGIPPG